MELSKSSRLKEYKNVGKDPEVLYKNNLEIIVIIIIGLEFMEH